VCFWEPFESSFGSDFWEKGEEVERRGRRGDRRRGEGVGEGGGRRS